MLVFKSLHGFTYPIQFYPHQIYNPLESPNSQLRLHPEFPWLPVFSYLNLKFYNYPL